MEPFQSDLETFYDTDPVFTNPFCHFLYFHMGLNGRRVTTTESKEVSAVVTTVDTATQTDKGNIFWTYFS
jgi:hypothetical protein